MLEQEAAGETVSPVLLAKAYVSLDRREEAFRKLAEALDEKDRHLLTLWTDPAWDSVRSDPRFREVLSKARRGKMKEWPTPC